MNYRGEFDTYEEAFAFAVYQARKYKQAHGLERPEKPYMKWSIKMIPNDPALRFGWERHCQAVEPDALLSADQLTLLLKRGVRDIASILHPA